MWTGIRVFALIVVPSCVALMIGLGVGKRQEDRKLDEAAKREADLRRQLARQAEFVRARDPLVTATDQPVVERLQANLDAALVEGRKLSNMLSRAVIDADSARKESAKALEDAKAEILERSKRIEVLEGELGALNQQVRDLGERMSRQNQRVAEAERLLATAAGDREAMKKNLDALLAERGEIEARLKSKETLIAELKKARDEEYAARETMARRGVAGRASRRAPETAGAVTTKPPVRQWVVASGVDVSVAESPRARANRSGPGKPSLTERAAKNQPRTGASEVPLAPAAGR